MGPVCALGGYIRKLVVEIVCILECASATLSGERVFFPHILIVPRESG